MRAIAVVAAFALCAAPAVADETTSELSFERFAEEQGPEHPLYCMYGYFASKTGNHETARRIFKRCVEEANNPAAMVYLSLFYEEGLGTAPDPTKAEALMRQAAEQGHSVAQYHLGKDLLRKAETAAERAEGLRWLERAAQQGDEDAASLLAGADG